MKKKLLLSALFLLVAFSLSAQKFSVRLKGQAANTAKDLTVANQVLLFPAQEPPIVLVLTTAAAPTPAPTYRIRQGDIKEDFPGDNTPHEIDLSSFDPDILFEIVDSAAPTTVLKSFMLKFAGAGNAATDAPSIILPSETIDEFFTHRYPDIKITRYGITVKDNMQTRASTKYSGESYTHIFFDQYGNNLYAVVPQGIRERQYVVHILYLAPQQNRELIYAVNESKSGFNPALSINNSDLRALLASIAMGTGGQKPKAAPVIYQWVDQEILLSTSTEEIGFDLYRVLVNKDTVYQFEKTKLAGYTIKMSPTYHVSLDVGLVRSDLENPTFELLPAAANPDAKVVKQSGGGQRGVVTVMATFYTSPIVLLEKYLFGMKIPDYKLLGRNYLDDHTLWERIYPTIGVGFTDKTLENLFFGVNWEIVRGGAVFAGGHYGKVNIYNAPEGFKFEETAVTDNDFKIRMNTAWRTGFAIGVKVDAKVIAGLFATK